MPRHKIIAAFNDYAGMIDAFRARAQQMRIAVGGDSVANVSGLPDNYVAKLLAVHPVRRVGMISLGPLLGVLGVKLLMIEDKDAMARFTGKLSKRNDSCAHDGIAVRLIFSRQHMRKIGKKGQQVWQQRRRERMRAAQDRSEKARKLANKRWSNVTASAARELSKGLKASPRFSAPRRGRPQSVGNGAAKGRAPRQ